MVTLDYRLPGYSINLRADNRGNIILTANPEFHWRTKHIEVQYYWIWEKVESKEIIITSISTKNMVIDELTKALDFKPFKIFQSMIGMY